MSEGPICKSCGHRNAPDAMFCSKCGSKMPSREAARTTDPDPIPAPEADAVPVPVPVPEPHPEPPPAPASEPPPAEPEHSAPKRARRVAASAKTMMGVGAPERAVIEAAKAAAAERRAAKQAAKEAPPPSTEEEILHPPAVIPAGTGRTMLGMPQPNQAEVAEAVERAKQHRAEREAKKQAAADGKHPSVRPEAALDPTTNRTMLGQPAPKKEEIEEAVAQRRAEKRDSKRPKGLDEATSSGRMRAPVMYPTDTGEEEALTLPTRKPPRSLGIVVLVLGLVVLAVGGGALAWALLSAGPEIGASVVQGEGGELLEIEVPGAADGTRVRFGGGEQPLEAGRARFPLSADDLELGDNQLTVDVVAPDGSVETEQVALHLEMRVRADLGPLASAPPAFDVIVEAPAGAEATLDGEALALDARGRGTRRYAIDPADASAEGMVEQVVRWRVQPRDGEPAQGELRTRIPLTSLQLDRPGTSVVTDQASVEFAGAVAPGASVTVDGHDVPVREGRFVHALAVPEVGERTVDVVARVAGRAPRIARVQIRRVADLEAEAASFQHNPELTYARISQNPATYRGQRVRFEGLVYNVDVRNGGSIVQILVRDCPEGDQCPLWVTYPAATDVERRARVRVLGTVAGEQQFRSQSGQIRTVPRVDAIFILPSEE